MSEVRSLVLRAPAKINLYLRILGRRTDGYHLLDSFIVPISLYDQLTLAFEWTEKGDRSPAISVSSNSPAVPNGPKNLAFRAADLFFHGLDATPAAVRVEIAKQIPVGSGLGGGSSDAAAVLLGLNHVMGEPYSVTQLAELGSRLGADVPVFVHGGPARVQGIGEQVTSLPLARPIHLVVCSDGFVLSTKDVYGRVDLSLTSGQPLSNIGDLVDGKTPISEFLVNDLEAAAAEIHAPVSSLKQRLLASGATGALMTGSGSAVFGVFSSQGPAQIAAERLRSQGLWAQAVHTLDVSPAVLDC